MILSTLIQSIDVVRNSLPQSNPDIQSVCFDSRKLGPGALFVAVAGTQTDGHQYIMQAVEQGAAAIVCQQAPAGKLPIPCIEVANSREALGLIASAFYGHPSRSLTLVGITGTNGKTTTATLLYRVFKQLGYACGLISTIENYVDKLLLPSHHTTPDSIELNQLLADMVAKGCAYCFMEVSSHAIDQGRIAGLQFGGAIFSNLTHDHLDYHGSFAAYLQCKKRLFDRLSPEAFALVNTDDKNGKVMIQNTKAKTYSYACKSMADFPCRITEQSVEGMLLRIDGREISTSFIGKHNAYNLLAVYAAARLLGAEQQEVLQTLSTLKSVSGRLEYIKGKKGITAVVDYAHTPDALKNALNTLRKILMPEQALYTVVGCGGDRDKTKRPQMARIALEQSSQVIFTSDNPRSEDPMDILQDMLHGLTSQEKARCLCIADRREAIKTAILMAPPKSIVLVAGKGHENYQEIKGIKHHFDDKEILAEYLA
ncbi:MAG: UDP-N-acetylmuramoyl-L-alanyl-D-glutamate--2,6-diaminopimelate ligase [Bacteroidales bacterium]|nr:UDP-N-acetylmuramoyl-L-alanyl-D-glutamate--2,6-diaminopimelate ligase [Bacteroidales bacterium]